MTNCHLTTTSRRTIRSERCESGGASAKAEKRAKAITGTWRPPAIRERRRCAGRLLPLARQSVANPLRAAASAAAQGHASGSPDSLPGTQSGVSRVREPRPRARAGMTATRGHLDQGGHMATLGSGHLGTSGVFGSTSAFAAAFQGGQHRVRRHRGCLRRPISLTGHLAILASPDGTRSSRETPEAEP
jgi:hypothetical protein